MGTIPHSEIISRWSDPNARPVFKGKLIDSDGCCCAQGDILRTYCGYSDDQLRSLEQSKADKEVAERLGISRFHAILIRIANDRMDGCPQDVLRAPEKIIGSEAQTMLAFARHLDRMTAEQWDELAAAGAASLATAWAAARDELAAAGAASLDASLDAALDASWNAGVAARDASRAAACAMNEIQAAAIMRANGMPFYFLPLFGFADPEAVMIEDAKFKAS